jgi:hypothetical protein
MSRAILVAGIAASRPGAGAQTTSPKALPLDNPDLEHLDIVVPDPAASAQIYARIFRSAPHQQPAIRCATHAAGKRPAGRSTGDIASATRFSGPRASLMSRKALCNFSRPLVIVANESLGATNGNPCTRDLVDALPTGSLETNQRRSSLM